MVVLALGTALSACSADDSAAAVTRAVAEAGYPAATRATVENGVVDVQYSTTESTLAARRDQLAGIAAAVWRGSAVPLDRVVVYLHQRSDGTGSTRSFTAQELASRLGPRPTTPDEPAGSTLALLGAAGAATGIAAFALRHHTRRAGPGTRAA